MAFTAEELAEMAVADQEIESSFCLTQNEIVQSRLRDRRSIFENLPFERRKVVAAQKAYYEANREKVAAAQKAYREANREKVAAAQKAYREANREKVAAAQKVYREANREKVAAAPADILKCFRLEHGYTQGEFAALLGVSHGCISLWESRSVPIDWELVQDKIPDILAFGKGG